MTRGSCCSTAVMISCRATGPLLSNVACATRQSDSRLVSRALHDMHLVAQVLANSGAFVLAEVPIAAVRPHLERREPPPPLVDGLISKTYYSILGTETCN